MEKWKIEYYTEEAEEAFMRYVDKEPGALKKHHAKKFVDNAIELYWADGAAYNDLINTCASLIDKFPGPFWDFIREEAGMRLREWQPRGVVSAFGKRYII